MDVRGCAFIEDIGRFYTIVNFPCIVMHAMIFGRFSQNQKEKLRPLVLRVLTRKLDSTLLAFLCPLAPLCASIDVASRGGGNYAIQSKTAECSITKSSSTRESEYQLSE